MINFTFFLIEKILLDFYTLKKRRNSRLIQVPCLLAIWGPNTVEQPEHLRVSVAQLRKKIDTESTPQLHHYRTLPGAPL